MTKKLFSNSCDQDQLKTRNTILNIIQVTLWFLTILTLGKLILNLAGGIEVPSLITWILATIVTTLTIRFEFWSMHFRAREFSRCGQDWVVSGLKDNPVFQEKFFTGKYHRDGDLNPLW